VAKARKAYDALTAGQKALVSDQSVARLKKAEQAIAGKEYVDEFESYKARKKKEAEALVQTGDSAAAKKLLSDAAAAIAALKYDKAKDLAGNKARVDAIYKKLLTDLKDRRAADKEGQETAGRRNKNRKGEGPQGRKL
jgi:hypothetical protein